MAKKKTKKNKNGTKFEYSNEIIGLIIILIAIIGLGGYGFVGNLVRSFAIFLVGTLYLFLLMLLIVFGIMLIFKKEKINYLNTRLLGIYIIVLSLLISFHVKYIQVNGTEGIKIITETWNNLLLSFKSDVALSSSGGGIIGAIFSSIFVLAFGKNVGPMIVVVVMFVLGILLLFNISIVDLYNKVKPKIVGIFEKDDSGDLEEDVINDTNRDEDIAASELESPAVVATPTKIEPIDDDVPIKAAPPKIVASVNEEVKDEVIINVNTNYQLPSINLLNTIKNVNNKENEVLAKNNIQALEKVLLDFDVVGRVVQVNIGPTVTQYELELKTGTKVNSLLSIEKEIALALAAKTIKIQAPIPGKKTIGIELPNKVLSSVSFKEVISKMPAVNDKNLLAVGLGKDIMGKVKWMEINTTPHLLVAGATGSGKSVCMNCIITSILMRTKPDQVKLVMVDPKKVELSMYNGVPHLLAPVVTDPKKASVALKNIVAEMEKRYDIFERCKVKNIKGYNDMAAKKPDEYSKMPYIVVIIDELADLMLVAKKEVEDSIMRITQMARAAGIHLIVATQRPSTNVITGVIKANIPSRISFAVSSNIDSRTILDATGAEKLLGKGDMLFLPIGDNTATRIQGAFVSEEEIQKVVNYVCEQQIAQYDETLTQEKNNKDSYDDAYESEDDYDDPLYNEIVEYVTTSRKVSASLLQRKYRIGYNRASRIVDLLESRGIIGPANGSKPREVLIPLEEEVREEE